MKLSLEVAKEIMERNGGSLYLRGTGITALPDNLTVGGYLDLEGCTGITALPDNLTVGGSLYLRGTGITALPDNLTVGGYLYLRGTGITAKEVRKPKEGEIRDGRYIYVDGCIFHYSGTNHKVGRYTVYMGKIKGQMLVTDGELWAHCTSLKDGVADLLFKRAKERGADQYKGIDINKAYSVEELKTMYRVITGACKAGTDHFVNTIKDLKERYTVSEAIEMTKGQYNSATFSKFFEVAE